MPSEKEKMRKNSLMRVYFRFLALLGLVVLQIQSAQAKQASTLPKSAIELHKITAEKLTRAFRNASDIEMQNCVKRLIKEKAISSSDWQKLLIALRDTTHYESEHDHGMQHKLCAEVQKVTDLRFGKNSLDSARGHLIHAISLALVEEGRNAWNEYDKALSSGKLLASNPDFVVKSLENIGFNFRENLYCSDAIHAFQLADQIIQNHKVCLPVQADLYNVGTDAIYRCSSDRDYSKSLFYKFASRAISLDKQLGANYADQLKIVTDLKQYQSAQEKEWAMKDKKFLKRQEEYQKNLKSNENN